MTKYIITLFLLLGYILKNQAQSEITTEELKTHINFLASDSLKGRYPGTKESIIAAKYIREQLVNAGAKPIYKNGFQSFEIKTNVALGETNQLSIETQQAKINEDYIPLAYSGNGNLNAEVIFTGYGLNINTDTLKWNDYKNQDVKGKWVMILIGDPENEKEQSIYVRFSDNRTKVLNAKDNGAAGVILVAGENYDKEDKLIEFKADRITSVYQIPVIQIKRTIADKILNKSGKTIAQLEQDLNKALKPQTFNTKTKVKSNIHLKPEIIEAQNIAAIFVGTDQQLKSEYIIIGAHYDHLGMGGKESGSRQPDTLAIHNGADDNASGIAALLEIAGQFQSIKPNRSIIFVAFDAEEKGLLGSNFFVNNLPVKKEQIKCMINLDMIGSMDTIKRNLVIGGTGTALEFERIIDSVSYQSNINISVSKDGFGPSDHSSFYAKNIPVLFFNTGATEFYHTPSDDTDKLNITGIMEISKLVTKISEELSKRNNTITYQEYNQPMFRTGKGFKVTLGIVPNFSEDTIPGLKIDGVRKSGPADKAGLKKGDIITALNGESITNIYDYMNRLNKLKAGQTVSVDIVRENQKIVLMVNL